MPLNFKNPAFIGVVGGLPKATVSISITNVISESVNFDADVISVTNTISENVNVAGIIKNFSETVGILENVNKLVTPEWIYFRLHRKI